MNKTNNTAEADGLLPFYSPSVLTSPGIRASLHHGEIIEGLRQHVQMGKLPCSFRSRNDERFMVVTTADRTRTFLLLPDEVEKFTGGLNLRELNDSTVAE